MRTQQALGERHADAAASGDLVALIVAEQKGEVILLSSAVHSSGR
jgi:hypothetical protein